MPMITGTGMLKVWRGSYSVATDGGTAGTKVMRSNDGAIPSGAVIVGGYLNIVAIPGSSGSATIAITSGQAANDLITQTAFGSSPFSGTGKAVIVPAFTGTTVITLTADHSPAVVIGTATITLASFELVLFWL